MKRIPVVTTASLSVAALVLTACGSDSTSNSADATNSKDAASGPRTVQLLTHE
jgi:ABC-type glycerol-3-phosphate transport system substrate-binding protein